MKFNFINNLSLFRTALIQKYLFINIYPDAVNFLLLKRRESFFKLTKIDGEKNYSIISSEHFDWNGDYSLLKNKLNEFVNRNNLKYVITLLGINEFKSSTITLQTDTDDIDLWFLENSAKFLPEGRPADEFRFSYEQIKEDESHKYFNLAIVRSDCINEIVKNLSVEGIRIYAVLPFHYAISSFDNKEEKNRLLLDYSSSKIIYAYLSKTSNFFTGEIYNKFITEDNGIRNLKNDEIEASLLQIKQNIALNFGNTSLNQLEIFLCCRNEDYESIKSNIETVFDDASINSNYETEEYLFIPSLLAYNKILKDNELKLNLLPSEVQTQEREYVEKQLSLKLILGIGGIIIFLLLISNIVDGFLRSSLEEEQSNGVILSSETMKVNNLQKENEYLEANYKLLKRLKTHGEKYSSLLFDISQFMKNGSCLTGLIIKENEDKSITIEMTGLAVEQHDIATIMKSMEDDKKYKDINLLYTSVLKHEEMQVKENLPQNKNLVQFNLSAKYYAD